MTEPTASKPGAKVIHWPPDMEPDQQTALKAAASAGKGGQPSTGACDACRARKVRCLANESSMSSKCQRCARAGRECIYTVHSKTRRRKRTDTRVKELEEKVKNLSMLLERGKLDGKGVGNSSLHTTHESEDMDPEEEEGVSEEGSDEGAAEEEEDPSARNESFDGFEAFKTHGITSANSKQVNSERSGNVRQGSRAERNTIDPASQVGLTSPDVIERGILTIEKAQELIDRYIHVLSPHYPAVVLPVGTRAATLREQRPVLFIAVLAAGAGNQDPALNLALNQEILQLYAKKVALKGEKSLDLVQSILISILWYYPPDRFEELKFHQYIHMAATMALDIGMGRKPRTARGQDPGGPGFNLRESLSQQCRNSLNISNKSYPDSSSIESRRTLLACYLSCSSVSISLRMPNMLRWSSWMEECFSALETSPEAVPSDKRLIAWIRTQRVVEECSNTFSLDDPGSTLSLSDPRVQQTLKGFGRQFENLRKEFTSTPGLVNEFLAFNNHVNNLYIHEIALHPEHEVEDFRPPFFVTSVFSKPKCKIDLTYVNAIMECVTSAQLVLKALIEMHWETIRALPAFLYARVLYAAVVLIKLYISTYSPESELGKIVDRESLMTQMYVERTLLQMKKVAGTDGKCIIGAKFYTILGKLVVWFRAVLSHPGGPAGYKPGIEPGRTMNEDFASTAVPTQVQAGQAYLSFGGQQSYHKDLSHNQDHEYFLTMSPLPSSNNPTSCPDQAKRPNNTALPDLHFEEDKVPELEHSNNRAANQAATYNQAQGLSDSKHPDPSLTTAATYNDKDSGGSSHQNHVTPVTDYSSPELMDMSATTAAKLPYDLPMEVDASMFNQLDGMSPFGYNQDPSINDWMFNSMDMAAMESISQGVDWSAVPPTTTNSSANANTNTQD